MNRLPFQPEVEGLRALAILAVVVGHAGVPFLQGGFVGVDLFFVLSGYLITGLLVAELSQSGGVRFAEFYARRFRRLLPALLVMLGVVASLATILLAPGEQIAQARTAAFVPWWLTNMRFAFAELDYFGHGAESELFLHTWSLGVEEQFYLVWPLLLWFLWSRAAAAEDSRVSQLVRTLVLLLLVSLLASLLLALHSRDLAFYTVFSRAWQFALGGIVFLRGHRLLTNLAARLERPLTAVASSLCMIGTLFVVGSVAMLGRGEQYPGLWATGPSLGAALILLSAQHGVGFLPGLLRSSGAQWLGRMSYGWYLWHWPALLLADAALGDLHWGFRLLAAAAALLPALLSYHWVEHPVRHARWLDLRPAAVVTTSLLLMAIATFAALQWRDSAQRWAAEPAQASLAMAARDLPSIYRLGCDDWYRSARILPCVAEDEGFSRTAVILGDSVVLQWYESLRAAFPAPTWRLVVLTKSACPMVHARFYYPRLGRPFYECEEWRQGVVGYLTSLSPDVIVTGSGASYDISEDEWIAGSMQMLAALSQTARQVVLLQPTPVLREDPLVCLARREWRPKWLGGASCRLQPSDESIAPELAANREVADAMPSVTILHLNDLVCNEMDCRAVRSGTPVYRDTQHLSSAYVEALSPVVAQRLRNILELEEE
ncbi:acyltransferase family protein [Pseudomarimonas salicorniae]|uniref:Acyltransferase n=1 Tax=Pseudomarimonas salicorniae TaxID=2933270 RepID=A0ABT0GGX4_9GAMM|nr:acyltransferase family protein [Lysobacter sp. CAU 1642]MCK7593322.1 acyltransferase [Lysobacter sp. CAU 1642]